MIALDLDQAENLALVGALGFAVAALVSLWLIKSVIQKLVLAVLLGLLAFATWSQRTSLEECADKVSESVTQRVGDEIDAVDPTETVTTTTDPATGDTAAASTTCTFFGVDVTVA